MDGGSIELITLYCYWILYNGVLFTSKFLFSEENFVSVVENDYLFFFSTGRMIISVQF